MISPNSSHQGAVPLRVFESILVALDGSLPAQAAAGVAIQLARAEQGAVRGLYVVDERLVMDPYANSDRELGARQGLISRPELIARFEGEGAAALRWLEASCHSAGVPVSTDLLLGAVPELILQEAAESELLAVGRRGLGHTGDGQHLGRNLRAIARHATWPVLIGGDARAPVRRLLLVYDPSRRNQDALAWAAVFERTLSNPAIVLAPSGDGSAPDPKFSPAEMQALIEGSGLTSYRVVRWEGNLAAEIIATAAQNNADLIIIGARRRIVLARSLLGPVLAEVLRSSALPVLLACPPKVLLTGPYSSDKVLT